MSDVINPSLNPFEVQATSDELRALNQKEQTGIPVLDARKVIATTQVGISKVKEAVTSFQEGKSLQVIAAKMLGVDAPAASPGTRETPASDQSSKPSVVETGTKNPDGTEAAKPEESKLKGIGGKLMGGLDTALAKLQEYAPTLEKMSQMFGDLWEKFARSLGPVLCSGNEWFASFESLLGNAGVFYAEATKLNVSFPPDFKSSVVTNSYAALEVKMSFREYCKKVMIQIRKSQNPDAAGSMPLALTETQVSDGIFETAGKEVREAEKKQIAADEAKKKQEVQVAAAQAAAAGTASATTEKKNT